MERRGTSPDMPMKPQVVAWELGKRIDDDAMISCDSGIIATWFARQILVCGTQMHIFLGNFATMACGLPYVIAAQIVHPGRQSVAFVGDGGLSMLIAEMATCVKYDLPVKVVVIKNNSFGQIKWEQMVMEGNPEFACDLQPIDFCKIAEGFGWTSFYLDKPAEAGAIIQQALDTRSEEHTSELQSRPHLVCRLLLEKKKILN